MQCKVLIGGNSRDTEPMELDLEEGSPQRIAEGGQSWILDVVIRGQKKIAKYYIDASPKANLQQRLLSLIKMGPIKGVLTVEHVFLDENNRLRGYIMSPIPPGYYQLSRLLSTEVRDKLGIRWLIDVFIAIYILIASLHKRGIVVGDVSPNNIFVNPETTEVLLIDVDSLQFNGYPCPVGTPQYLHPSLYGIPLHQKPMFTTMTDWYAFAVILFAGLFNSLPYDGIHPELGEDYQKRARQGAWILDPKVKRTKAFIDTKLTADLLALFERYFVKGELVKFPKNLLFEYRKECVYMDSSVYNSTPQGMTTYEVKLLLRTRNPILFSRSTQQGVIAISCDGQDQLYVTRYLLTGNKVINDTLLPVKYESGTQFEYFDHHLLIATPTQIYVISVSNEKPALIDTITYQGLWCVSGGAMFVLQQGIITSYIYRLDKREEAVVGQTKNQVQPLAMHPPQVATASSVVLIYKSGITIVQEGEPDVHIPCKLSLDEIVNVVPDYSLLRDKPGPFILRVQGKSKGEDVIKTIVVDIATRNVIQRQEPLHMYPAKLVGGCFVGKYLILVGNYGVYREDVLTGKRGVAIQTANLPQKRYSPFALGVIVEHSHEVAYVKLAPQKPK